MNEPNDILKEKIKAARWDEWQERLFFGITDIVEEDKMEALLKILLMDFNAPSFEVFKRVSDLICEAYIVAYDQHNVPLGMMVPIRVGPAVFVLMIGIMEANTNHGPMECYILTNLIFQYFEQSFNEKGMENLIKEGKASRA